MTVWKSSVPREFITQTSEMTSKNKSETRCCIKIIYYTMLSSKMKPRNRALYPLESLAKLCGRPKGDCDELHHPLSSFIDIKVLINLGHISTGRPPIARQPSSKDFSTLGMFSICAITSPFLFLVEGCPKTIGWPPENAGIIISRTVNWQ